MFEIFFHYQSILMTFLNQFNSLTDVLMEKLRLKADGKTVVTLFNEINRVTLDAIALVPIYKSYPSEQVL